MWPIALVHVKEGTLVDCIGWWVVHLDAVGASPGSAIVTVASSPGAYGLEFAASTWDIKAYAALYCIVLVQFQNLCILIRCLNSRAHQAHLGRIP